jgi:hypothetical protein
MGRLWRTSYNYCSPFNDLTHAARTDGSPVMRPDFPCNPPKFGGALPQICHTSFVSWDLDSPLFRERSHRQDEHLPLRDTRILQQRVSKRHLFGGQAKRYRDRSGNRWHDQRIGTPVPVSATCGRILLHHRYKCMQYWYARKQRLDRRTGPVVLFGFPPSVIHTAERESAYKSHLGICRYDNCMAPFVIDSVPLGVSMAFSGLNASLPRYGLSGTKLLEGFSHAHSVDSLRCHLYRLRLRRHRAPVDAAVGARQHHAHLSGASLRFPQINQLCGVGRA